MPDIPESILLDKLWENYYGLPAYVHSFSRWLPFYMVGRQSLLLQHERDRMYLEIVPGIVNKVETEHFKRHQLRTQVTKRREDAIDYHFERVLMFYEFVQVFPFLELKDGKWDYVLKDMEQYTGRIVYKFKMVFPRLEAILQYRRLGISLPTHSPRGLPMDIHRLCTHWMITMLIDYQIWKRDHSTLDVEQFYMRRYGQVPTDRKLQVYRRRIMYVEKLLLNCGGLNDYRIVGLSENTTDFETQEEWGRT